MVLIVEVEETFDDNLFTILTTAPKDARGIVLPSSNNALLPVPPVFINWLALTSPFVPNLIACAVSKSVKLISVDG